MLSARGALSRLRSLAPLQVLCSVRSALLERSLGSLGKGQSKLAMGHARSNTMDNKLGGRARTQQVVIQDLSYYRLCLESSCHATRMSSIRFRVCKCKWEHSGTHRAECGRQPEFGLVSHARHSRTARADCNGCIPHARAGMSRHTAQYMAARSSICFSACYVCICIRACPRYLQYAGAAQMAVLTLPRNEESTHGVVHSVSPSVRLRRAGGAVSRSPPSRSM